MADLIAQAAAPISALSYSWTALAVFFAVSFIVVAALVGVLWRALRKNETLRYEFVSIIAHTFRTPLTGIKWSAEDMLSKEQDGYARQSLQDILKLDEKLIKMTGTLIELTDSDNASKASYSLTTVGAGELTRAAVNDLKDVFHEKNIFLSLQLAEPDFMVSVDRPRIDFVLQTVLENACHYTPPGRNVEVGTSRSGRKAVITVSDHGIGMDKATLQHLFAKFYRAPNARTTDTDGFGIGLFMARSIVRRLGGKIEAGSQGVGKGSTFRIILPIVG